MTPRNEGLPGDSIHPNDRAVLYDLVDGRLAPRAEDEMRRRLDDEPALRVAYQQIVELRGRLAALPVPALPADFLERVRAKAGFPAAPAPAVVSSAGVSPAPGPPTDRSPAASRTEPVAAGAPIDAGGPKLSRVLSFARYAYGIAALLVVALGVAYWKFSEDDAASSAGTESARRDVPAAATEGGAKAREERRKPGADLEWKDAGPAKNEVAPDGSNSVALGGGGGSATPHFGPVGALPPGLRTPSDNPADARPPASPMPLEAGAARADKPDAAADEGSFAKRKSSSAEPQDLPLAGGRAARPSATSAARPSATSAATDDAGAPPVEAVEERAGEPSAGTLAGSPSRAGYAAPSPSSDPDEDVLYVYADSLDVARAEVSLWVADARAGRAPDARRLLPRRADLAPALADKESDGGRRRPAPAEAESPASTGRPAPGSPAADSPQGETPVAVPASPVERMLGAFVVELDAPAFERLSRSLPPREGTIALLRRAEHDDSVAAAGANRSLPTSDGGTSGDDKSRAGLPGALPAEPGAPAVAPMPTPPPAAPVPTGPAPVVSAPAAGGLPAPAGGALRSDAAPGADPAAAKPSAPPPSAPSDADDAAKMDATKLMKDAGESLEKPSIRRVRIVVLPSR